MQLKQKRALLTLKDLELFVASAIQRSIRTSWTSKRTGIKMHTENIWKDWNQKEYWKHEKYVILMSVIRFVQLPITRLYGDHDWVCTCLRKESDIVELGIVEVVLQIRPKRNNLTQLIKVDMIEFDVVEVLLPKKSQKEWSGVAIRLSP